MAKYLRTAQDRKSLWRNLHRLGEKENDGKGGQEEVWRKEIWICRGSRRASIKPGQCPEGKGGQWKREGQRVMEEEREREKEKGGEEEEEGKEIEIIKLRWREQTRR
jgi:hypothetical protein